MLREGLFLLLYIAGGLTKPAANSPGGRQLRTHDQRMAADNKRMTADEKRMTAGKTGMAAHKKLPKLRDPVPEPQGTWDLVLVHCEELYNTTDENLTRQILGKKSGRSILVDEVAKGALGFRKVLIYEKCGSNLVGQHFTRVEARPTPNILGTENLKFYAPYEPTYLEHVVESYDDLPDWTVFAHGFPEDHNKHFFDWLAAFRRPVSKSPVYIPMSVGPWTKQGVQPRIQERLQIEKMMKFRGKQEGEVNFMANAVFMVSKHAILRKPIPFWKNLEYLAFDEPGFFLPTPAGASAAAAAAPRPSNASGDAVPLVGRADLLTAVSMLKRSVNSITIAARANGTNETTNGTNGTMASSYAAVGDAEAALGDGRLEGLWPVVFGRPPRDEPPDEKFYCTWFANTTIPWRAEQVGRACKAACVTPKCKDRCTVNSERLSPCGGSEEAFRQCWKKLPATCP